jgi:drug/metabolite transporter (DMT)-like permease
MTSRQLAELLALAALWGGSFLCMRLGAADFGPVALVFVRCAGAALLLLPVLLLRGEGRALRARWRDVALVGVLNSAVPFVLFAAASLVLSAGLMAVFNATAPLWAAVVAWIGWGERLDARRAAGLGLGFAGVVALSWDTVALKTGGLLAPALAVAACLGATLLYGLAANLARRRLADVPPMALATGSQLASALLLAAPAAALWPAEAPGASAWGAALLLAAACTALAYVLYFRLIAQVGAARAISVTFLIPAFAIAWGAAILGERPSGPMLAACAVILLGTALATDALPGPASWRARWRSRWRARGG